MINDTVFPGPTRPQTGIMASKQQDYLDDELDFDDEYFARTYRPLSNLPTPPFSSSASQASRSPRIDPLQSESHSALLGQCDFPTLEH